MNMKLLLGSIWMMALATCCGCGSLTTSEDHVSQLSHELVFSAGGRVVSSPRVVVLEGQEATIRIEGGSSGNARKRLDLEVTIHGDGYITTTVTTPMGTKTHRFEAGTASSMKTADQFEIDIQSRVEVLN